MNETRWKPTTGTRCPTLFDKWDRDRICPVAWLDIPRPLFTHSWTTGGKSECSGTRQIQTADLSVHSRTCQQPDLDEHPKTEDQLYPRIQTGGGRCLLPTEQIVCENGTTMCRPSRADLIRSESCTTRDKHQKDDASLAFFLELVL